MASESEWVLWETGKRMLEEELLRVGKWKSQYLLVHGDDRSKRGERILITRGKVSIRSIRRVIKCLKAEPSS